MSDQISIAGLDNVVLLLAPIGDFSSLLSDDEARIVAAAIAGRRREYSTGRALAHRAFERLGIAATTLPTGPVGQPLWPQGVVGSISHTSEQAICAAASQANYQAIGVDLEHAGRVTPDLVELLITRVEQQRYEHLDLTLIFSAKEACYKLLHALVGEFVDFLSVEIALDVGEQRFCARYLGEKRRNAVITKARGYYRSLGNHWLTCIVLPVAS